MYKRTAVISLLVFALIVPGVASGQRAGPPKKTKKVQSKKKPGKQKSPKHQVSAQAMPDQLLPTKCGNQVDTFLKFMLDISKPGNVSISRIWGCKRDPNSPTGIEKPGEYCKETTFISMGNGGISYLSNKGKKPTEAAITALLKQDNLKTNDAVRRVPLDIWYQWDRVLHQGRKHHFTGRYCTEMKGDYIPGRSYLKNSIVMKPGKRKGHEEVTAIAKKVLKPLVKMAELYMDKQNRLSGWMGFSVNFDETTCKIDMGVYTGLVGRRTRSHRFHGGAPVGAPVAFFHDVELKKSNQTNSFTFSGEWKRSLVTDNWKPIIRGSMLSWVRDRMHAQPLVNWKNWDLQMRLSIEFSPGENRKYGIGVFRDYCLYRHKKVASDVKPDRNNHFKVGKCTDIGRYYHVFHVLRTYNKKNAKRYSSNNRTHKLIKKEVDRASRFNIKCPWAMKTPAATVQRFGQFSVDEKNGKFTIPGKNSTYPFPYGGALKKSPLRK